MLKFVLDKYFEQTRGFYPFFKYCPKQYHTHYINKRSSDTLGYDYNWENPTSLNEKIRWLIYNERLKSKSILTDKIKMKAYVTSKIGEGHVAQLYGVWDKFDDIDFDYIPNKFALKANCGWKMNLFVNHKEYIAKHKAGIKKVTSEWLKTRFEQYSLEPQYADIEHKLFIEYLRPIENYKKEPQIHCFNGNPVMIEMQLGINGTEGHSVFFDTDWKKLPYTTKHANLVDYNPEKPEYLDEMVEYAKVLSEGFSYVRIDFAKNNDNIHVVELTFTPFSAMIPFTNSVYDFELGKMLDISKCLKNI